MRGSPESVSRQRDVWASIVWNTSFTAFDPSSETGVRTGEVLWFLIQLMSLLVLPSALLSSARGAHFSAPS